MVSADPEWSKTLIQIEYTKEQENYLWQVFLM